MSEAGKKQCSASARFAGAECLRRYGTRGGFIEELPEPRGGGDAGIGQFKTGGWWYCLRKTSYLRQRKSMAVPTM